MLYFESKIVVIIMAIIGYSVDSTISSISLLPDGIDLCIKKTSAGKLKSYQYRTDWRQQYCMKYRTTPIVYYSAKTFVENKKLFLDYNFNYQKTLSEPLKLMGCALDTIGWCRLFGVGELNDCLDQLRERGFDTYSNTLPKTSYSRAVPNLYTQKYKAISLQQKFESEETDEPSKSEETDEPSKSEDIPLQIDDSFQNDGSSENDPNDDTLESYNEELVEDPVSSTTVEPSLENNTYVPQIALGNADRYSIYISHFKDGLLKALKIMSPPKFCKMSCKEEIRRSEFSQIHHDLDMEKLKKKYKGKIPSNTLKDNKAVPIGGYADQYALYLLAYDKSNKDEKGFDWCAHLFTNFQTEVLEKNQITYLNPASFKPSLS